MGVSFTGDVTGKNYPTRYRVNDDGTISTLQSLSIEGRNLKKTNIDNYKNQSGNFPFTNIVDAQNEVARKQQASIKNLQDTYEKRLADVTSQENTRNSLAAQIAALTGDGSTDSGATAGPAGPEFNQALSQLSANRNYGASDLANRLNFQVSDEQIINDYNQSKLGRLNSVVSRGNAQIAGIQERLNAAQTLLNQLPSGDARRTSSGVYVNQLKSDLTSVQSAVTDASNQIKDFKPITA